MRTLKMFPRLFLFAVLVIGTLSSLVSEENFISYLEGDVTVRHLDEEIFPDFGSPLFEGDRIATGADGRVIIELAGGRVLKLEENSVLTLENTSNNTRLNLTEGSLFSKVKKLTSGSFTVMTPTVVAGVRGTEFFLSYGKTIEESPDIWLCVNEGAVEVGLTDTGESVIVQEGEGINIPGGNRLTDPRFYAWTEDLNWNTDPAAGSVEDNTDLEGLYADLLDQDYF